MTSEESHDDAQLRVASHVLIQLGRELVTDAEQAILECVKNAYDADSPGCKIVVDTKVQDVVVETGPASRLAKFSVPSESVTVRLLKENGKPVDINEIEPDEIIRRELSYVGKITVEDTGDGLDSDQLKSSWLVISNSNKRSDGGPKAKTKKGRTPLGDKGLGRLGTMKLGDILSIETAKSGDSPLSVAKFRWADCTRAQTVDEIPVTTKEIPNNKKFKGTRVSVLGLSDLAEWRKPNRSFAIARRLAQLISPFEATATFPVYVEVDGVETSLVAVTADVVSRSMASFNFEWISEDSISEPRLKATARFRKSLLATTNSESQRERTERVFGDDGGQGFIDNLEKFGRLRGYNRPIKTDKDGPWFIELEQTYLWSEIASGEEEAICDPGSFKGAFYYYHLNKLNNDGASTIAASVSSSFIKEMAGISILREGFRVRSPGDWLNLAGEATSGSTYSLRVENTLGYFALTGDENYSLVEKSDREGFVQDAYFRGFLQIARMCRKFANDSMENVRRSVDLYAKQIGELSPGRSEKRADPISQLKKSVGDAAQVHDLLGKRAAELKQGLKNVDKSVNDGSAARVVQLATAALSTIEQVQGKLGTDQASNLSRLESEMEDQREQMLSLFESAAVGLSARGLAHEFRTHIEDIRRQTNLIQKSVAADNPSVNKMLRAIRGSCSAISSAASLIDPLLPRSRALKEEFELEAFIREYVDSRRLSLSRYDIDTSIISGTSLRVRMNRSRLLQVIDNLVQNSVYWLRKSGNLHGIGQRTIYFVVKSGGLEVWDSGPGISQKVEDSLFEIFVTMKPDANAGQGLGLFIVTQLLELDGCQITLRDERNRHGRRYKFFVDLSSVSIDGTRK